MVVVVGQKDVDQCSQMREECSLETQMTQLDGYPHVTLNISCYCKQNTHKDVSRVLEEVAKVKCSWIPYVQGMTVNASVLHLVGCSLQEKMLPESVLRLLRRTQHLHVYVERAPSLRLTAFRQMEATIPFLSATFVDSNLSGLPEGVLGGAELVRVKMERCDVKVLESRAFSGFSPTDDVFINLIDVSILTLKMVAFDLPPSAVVNFHGGKVLAWETSGYSGGSHLSLHGVNIGRLLSGAIHIQGLKSLSMQNCSIAKIYKQALRYQNFRQSRALHKESSATFIGNNFILGSSKSFIDLCGMDRLLWQNNTFASMTSPPLRLQEPECETERDWKNVISLTGINCSNCEDFRNPDAQTCAVYETGYCLTCKEQLDSCNLPVLSYLIHRKCPVSHPNLSAELEAVCNVTHIIRPEPRSLEGSGMVLIPLSLWVMVGGLVTMNVVFSV